MTDARPAFDRAAVERQVGGDRALAVEIMQMFVEDCPQRIAAIRAALAQGDPAALSSAAHTLKGSASYLAAPLVVEAAARVERIGREAQMAEAPAAVADLEREAGRLVAEIQRTGLVS